MSGGWKPPILEHDCGFLMSFASDFRIALKKIEEEIAYFRTFAALDGMQEPSEVLTELREKWHECLGEAKPAASCRRSRKTGRKTPTRDALPKRS